MDWIGLEWVGYCDPVIQLVGPNHCNTVVAVSFKLFYNNKSRR